MLFFRRKSEPTTQDRADMAMQNSYAMDSGELYRIVSNGLGTSMTAQRAMQAATVNTCVRIISESVATLPFEIYRKRSDGGREKALDHPLYDLLRYKPNSWQTAYEFWELMTRSILLRGNGYSIKNSVRGEIRELLPVHPDNMTVKQNDNFRLEYTAHRNGIGAPVQPDKLLHIRDATDNGYLGISRIKEAARAINIYIEAEKTGQKSLENGFVSQGVIEAAKAYNSEQKKEFAKSFRGLYGGAENAGATPLLEDGMTYKTINMTMEDAQFLETRRFQKSDIFGIFRVPPHIAQDYEKTTSWGTGIEQVSLQFVIFSLLPIVRRVEGRAAADLLSRRERREFEIKFNLNSLLRGDLKARSEFYSKGLQNGWFSINEVRRLENMNPIDGGDAHRAQSNTEDILEALKKGFDDAA